MKLEEYLQAIRECPDELVKVVESQPRKSRKQAMPRLSIEYKIEDGFIFFMNLPKFDEWISYLKSKYKLTGIYEDSYAFEVLPHINFKTYNHRHQDFPGVTKEFNEYARRKFCRALVFKALDLQEQLGISRISSDDIDNSDLPESLVRKVEGEYNTSLKILSLGLWLDPSGGLQSEEGKLICARNIANFVIDIANYLVDNKISFSLPRPGKQDHSKIIYHTPSSPRLDPVWTHI